MKKNKEEKPRVLVVDDEWSMRELLRNTLGLSGFEVFLASDDAEFREMAFKNPPDIIILDLMLGDKDGMAIYHELLAQGLDREIPVVFISALAEDRPPSPPRADRKFALIGKPFDPDALVRDIQKMLSSPP